MAGHVLFHRTVLLSKRIEPKTICNNTCNYAYFGIWSTLESAYSPMATPTTSYWLYLGQSFHLERCGLLRGRHTFRLAGRFSYRHAFTERRIKPNKKLQCCLNHVGTEGPPTPPLTPASGFLAQYNRLPVSNRFRNSFRRCRSSYSPSHRTIPELACYRKSSRPPLQQSSFQK